MPITRNLCKKYQSTEPLELLACRELGELAYQADEAAIKEAVEIALPLSQFRKVWVYEPRLGLVTYTFARDQES
jgi:hypothetical protein